MSKEANRANFPRRSGIWKQVNALHDQLGNKKSREPRYTGLLVVKAKALRTKHSCNSKDSESNSLPPFWAYAKTNLVTWLVGGTRGESISREGSRRFVLQLYACKCEGIADLQELDRRLHNPVDLYLYRVTLRLRPFLAQNVLVMFHACRGRTGDVSQLKG